MAQQSSSWRLFYIAQVTVAESRENDTLGNAMNIFEDYVAPSIAHFSVTDAFVVYADNNNAASYALVKMLFIGATPAVNNNSGSVLRMANDVYSIRNISTSTSAWCSQGTVLSIYKLEV